MSKGNYFCLQCKGRWDTEEAISAHPCPSVFRMVNGTITIEISNLTKLKRTRWGRFIDALFSMDIAWGLAFMGLVVMNCVLIRHINLTFTESLIESLSLGFAIPRLLK